jgi:hypothetical protein
MDYCHLIIFKLSGHCGWLRCAATDIGLCRFAPTIKALCVWPLGVFGGGWRLAAGSYLSNPGPLLRFKLNDLMKRVGLAIPPWRAKKRRTLRVLFQQDRAVIAFCSARRMVG